jgi:[ribosomal protein S5]-alanine N-acetyltransferase
LETELASGDLPIADLYFLKTARLGFRCWTPQDLPLALAIWGDAAVTRFTGGPFSEQQVRERLAREIAAQESYRLQYWPIFLLATGEHVGAAGMRPRKPEEDIFSMGFYLRPQYWRQGFAEEAGRAVCEYAFGALGIRELFAAHHPENAASGAVLRKLGFTYTHKEFYPPTDLMHTAYALKPVLPEA